MCIRDRFTAEHGPIMETEYLREEAPRRIWDDFSPPDFDYKTKWGGKGGRKQVGIDFYDMTSEDVYKRQVHMLYRNRKINPPM